MSEKEKLKTAHKVKMEAKKRMRDYLHAKAAKSHIFANQSKHSDNYGETPQEQAKRMLAKNSS